MNYDIVDEDIDKILKATYSWLEQVDFEDVTYDDFATDLKFDIKNIVRKAVKEFYGLED